MRQRLSIALIVRDEALELPECLAAVAGLADEVCVVDTGSTDGTVPIAEAAGARVGRFAWRDDFSAARNASLEMCTGDWIFVLDADERIAKGDFEALRAPVEGPVDRCYRLVTRNYTRDESRAEFQACLPDDVHGQGYSGWFPSTKVRLFPNREDLRFEGKVHELVNGSAERAGLGIEDCPVPVHHYPLRRSEERLRARGALYVKLGREKVAEAPEEPQGYVELGNQYSDLGDYAGAVAAYRECLKRDPRHGTALRDLGAALFLLGRGREAEGALRLAVAVEPLAPDGWRNLGVVRAGAQDWREAEACFRRGVELRPGWSEGLRHLSVALERLGRLEEALERSREALEANPASAACMDLLTHQTRAVEGGSG